MILRALVFTLLMPIMQATGCAATDQTAGGAGTTPPVATGDVRQNLPSDTLAITLGEVARLPANQQLRFAEILEDNRCPANARCVQLGEAAARFAYTDADGREHSLRLTIPGQAFRDSHGAHVPVDAHGHRVTLLALDPYPGHPDQDPAMTPTATVRLERVR
jgi:hypothetical protein